MSTRNGTSRSGRCEGDPISGGWRWRTGMPGSTGRRTSTTCSWPRRRARRCSRGTYAHDENGLSALCRMLVRLEVVLVAIERPDGLLVERLLGRGAAGAAAAPEQGGGGA